MYDEQISRKFYLTASNFTSKPISGFRQRLRGSGHGPVGWEYSLRDIKLMWLHWYLEFRLFGVRSSGNLKEGRNLRTQDFPLEITGLALSVP